MINLLSYKTLYNFALSEKVKLKIEKFILVIAMISFLIHLSLIYLKKYNVWNPFEDSNFFDNPIEETAPKRDKALKPKTLKKQI